MRRLGLALTTLAATLSLSACPKGLPRGLPPDELYRLGVESYEEQRWGRAIEALQRLLLQDPGHPKADSAQYLIGESYFQQKQFLTAAVEFLRLAQNRPAGPLADDSRYRVCESYYRLSPRPELDQEYTEDALDQCRSVALLYPTSPFASESAARVRELTDKLARKHFLNARYYFRRRAYDSALVYLEYLLENFKGASIEPEALLTLYQTYRKLGYVQEGEETRERLLREYPDSQQARELGRSG